MVALGILAIIILLAMLFVLLDEAGVAPPSAKEQQLEVQLDALRTAQRLDLAAHAGVCPEFG